MIRGDDPSAGEKEAKELECWDQPINPSKNPHFEEWPQFSSEFSPFARDIDVADQVDLSVRVTGEPNSTVQWSVSQAAGDVNEDPEGPA